MKAPMHYDLLMWDPLIKIDGKVIMDLFDRKGKLLSSYDVQRNKHYQVIDITCRSTGVHQVALSFSEGKAGCAVVVMGFSERAASYDQYLK